MSPITPKLVAKKKADQIPSEVFDAFDALIIQNYCDGKAIVLQKVVVEQVKKSLPDFKPHWLNVEAAYESVGWKVEYDRPGFNETYGAKFTFTAKAAI